MTTLTQQTGAPGSTKGPESLDDFMAHAIAMEAEAAVRYDELADAMDMHNNVEVASLFRRMAVIERKHAEQLLAQMGWSSAPRVRSSAWRSDTGEGPETAASEDIHYLMQPYHALQIALRNEERAAQFFGRLAEAARDVKVRDAALELQREEQEHVALVHAWLAKVPEPAPDWAVDPDPPRYTD